MHLIKKIKEKDLDVLILIVLMVMIPIFVVPLHIGDELWNFAFIYKMDLGYVPYQDLNIIIPPLFHVIGLIFLKIFGANLLSFRIYNLVIITAVLFLTFKIFKTLKFNKKNNIINIILIYIPFSTMFAAGANYNKLAYIPILISLLLLLKNNKNYTIHGILVFITLLIKQNIGVFLGAGIGIYILIQKKDIIKNLFKIFIVNAIGIGLFLLILYKYGILYDFYFYVVGGIKSFSANNTHITYTILLIFIIIFINIIVTYFLKKSNTKEKNEMIENVKIIYCIGMPLLLVAYPIFNLYHIYLAIFILWIGFMYIVNATFISEVLTDKLVNIVIIILLLFVLCKNAFVLVNEFKKYDVVTDNKSPYYGALILEELEDHIKNICEFISVREQKGYNTIVLSGEANLYMVPMNRNNKNGMDLPFNGNLGNAGELGLIEQMSLLENTFVLIFSDEQYVFWQESMKVREYIQKELDKIGTVEYYDIYYKK